MGRGESERKGFNAPETTPALIWRVQTLVSAVGLSQPSAVGPDAGLHRF
jgi:hypothetical protein